MTKTNAMRLLDSAKINYSVNEYEVTDQNSFGKQAAEQLSMSSDEIFKTLVTRGDKTGINIFCIPVSCHLDLKKAAKVSGNKKLDMVLAKDVLGVAGYIVGACSPVGMKKKYPIFFDETAEIFAEIGISAGARGLEIVINPNTLCDFINAKMCDLT